MPEARERWVAEAGVGPDADAEALERAGRPGGPYPSSVPDALAEVYAARDLSPDAHREAYVGLLSTVVDARAAEALYARILVPDGWVAYADALEVLRALRAGGVAIAAVSNVGFDLRPVLDGLGLSAFLDACVMSWEVGATKPDARVFQAALDALDVPASSALMVGDHPEADAGARALGIETLILPMTPPGSVHGLARVLDLV